MRSNLHSPALPKWGKRILGTGEAGAGDAVAEGCTLSVDSDAHSTERLGNVLYGVGVSHRAWVPPERVLNAPPPDEMLARLKSATRAGR
jgi:hypothetical protein